MNLKKYKSFFLGIGILGGAIAIVITLIALKPKPEEEESKKPPLVVRTAEAISKEQTVYSTFQGEVRAKTDIELVTQVTGKVMSISNKFIEGGEFAPGETLLQIDEADYQVALKSAEASVASAQVDLDVERATAATNAKEWQDLQGKPIEEANPLRLNKPQIDRANARLDAARAELAAAKLNYDRTKISAPFAGRIMKASAELGQFMSRGSSIGRVFATNTMEVRIPMTDVQISELGLSLGYSAQSAGVDGIPATVTTVFGDHRRSWDGFVKSVDASIDNETRLLFATVMVDKPFAQRGPTSIPLVPGLFVDVEIASPNKVNGLELPRTALRNGNQVYVYENDELKLKPVKVIYTSQEVVIVKHGVDGQLSLGEKVITSSVPGAYSGMPVKLTQEAQAVVDSQDSMDTELQASSEELGVDSNEAVAPKTEQPDVAESDLTEAAQEPSQADQSREVEANESAELDEDDISENVAPQSSSSDASKVSIES